MGFAQPSPSEFLGGTDHVLAELWRTDGTMAGTTLVDDIRSGAQGPSARGFELTNGVLVDFE